MTSEISNDIKENVDPEIWLEQHGDALYRFALIRVQLSHTAEDLVQETLMSGLKSIHTFHGRSSLRTWLMSILRRRIADHFGVMGREFQTQFESFRNTGENDDIDISDQFEYLFRPINSKEFFGSAIERKEFWEIVRECIHELPTHFQEAMLLRMKEENGSLEELSAELEISQSNLSVRLFRARLLLRSCLEHNWQLE